MNHADFIRSQDFGSFLLSEITTHNKYAKYVDDSLERKEAWTDIINRATGMHLKKFPELAPDIEKAFDFVRSKRVMPSMRSLQFAGLAIELNPARIYNCAFLPVNDVKAFGEIMFLLLSGCGVGYSVQRHHVEQLPKLKMASSERTRRFLIQDSIEGWADAVKALAKSHFNGTARIVFDYRAIRAKGSRLNTAGGIAPGHEGLQTALLRIDQIFVRKQPGSQLSTLDVHDIICHIASAVLSGGIRRSAMIALFDVDDHDMFLAKTGAFYEKDQQRCFSNNSCVLLRSEMDREKYMSIWERILAIGTGEPGIFLTNDLEMGTNPCCEISLQPYQFCNLTEIDAAHFEDNGVEMEFYERCRIAAFIATLQASFTDFHYLRSHWKKTTEREALIGVGLTGLASKRLTNDMLKRGAEIVTAENERVAKIIGIRKAHRCTTLKPSGTTSILMNTSSGISAWYDHFYYRRLRLNTESLVYRSLKHVIPWCLESDVIRPHDTAVLTLPMRSTSEAAIIRSQETAQQFLERVKEVFTYWITPGHRKGSNTNNISSTCNVRETERMEVIEWLFHNRDFYNGITVFPFDDSESVYKQLPFESIDEATFDSETAKLEQVRTQLMEMLVSWSGNSSQTVEEKVSEAIEMSVDLEPACSGTSCELTHF